MERAVSELAFAPVVPPAGIAVLACIVAALLVLGIVWRIRGMAGRTVAAAVLLLALSNPLVLVEEREALPDVAFLVVDESGSQKLADRSAATESARLELEDRIQGKGLELRVIRTGSRDASPILGALQEAAQEVAAERVSGAVLLTDGLADDEGALQSFPGPVHALISGGPDESDRRVRLLSAPTFGIVREKAEIVFVVEESGTASGTPANVEIRVGRDWVEQVPAVPGVPQTVRFPVDRAGSIPVEIRAPLLPEEVTGRNNIAAFTLEGVRDRLRVLLVSGSPHPAARVWRNLLRADPAVDLVHFTILRLTASVDLAPSEELSLIEFPVRRLFLDEIDQFDLIIFDRYERRGFLPEGHIANIVRYVREGGAVLVAGGGEFAGVQGLSGGPLDAILPLSPTGSEHVTAYNPALTDMGRRHPVTAGIAASIEGAGPWYRLVETDARSGRTLLAGTGGRPLLALDRVDEGRIGVLASEHAWLWSRGHGGGGPHRELFRRVAHWLMREPDLEEEALRAKEADGAVLVSRRTLEEEPAEVRVVDPDGREALVNMEAVAPGLWQGAVEDAAPGLYRFASGEMETLAIVGGRRGRELEEVVSTGEALMPLAQATGGIVRRLSDGIPSIRRVAAGRPAFAADWLAFPRRDAYRVASTELRSLMPPWLAVVLILCALAAAWIWESGAGLRRWRAITSEVPADR